MSTINTFLNINTASGAENGLISKIKEYLEEKNYDTYTDKCGNLIAKKGSGEKKAAVFTNVDAAGLIVTFIEDNGCVRVSPLGGIDFRSALYAKISSEDGSVSGLLLPDAADSAWFDRTYASFGFSSGDEAKSHFSQGDIIYFDSDAAFLKNGNMYAHGAGVKSCAAAMCDAAESVVAEDTETVFVFCVQKELGLRGAYQAAFSEEPDVSLVVEPYDGDREGLKILDKTMTASEEVTEKIEKAADACGVELKRTVNVQSVSDASRVQSAGHGAKTGVLLMPTKNIGTVREQVNAEKITNISHVISEFLNNI